MQDAGLVDMSAIIDSEWPEFVEQLTLLYQSWPGISRPPPADHKCGRGCKFVVSPNYDLFACVETGKLHWCTSKSCRERQLTEEGAVCVITGRAGGVHMVELSPHDLFKGNRFAHDRGRLMAEMGLFDDSAGAFASRKQTQAEEKQLHSLRQEASTVISAISFSDERREINRQVLTKLTATCCEQIAELADPTKTTNIGVALDQVATVLEEFALEAIPYRYSMVYDTGFVNELTDEVLKWWKVGFTDPCVPSSFSVYVVCMFSICFTGLVSPDTGEVIVRKLPKAAIYFVPFVHLNRFYGRTKRYTQGERALRRAIVCFHCAEKKRKNK